MTFSLPRFNRYAAVGAAALLASGLALAAPEEIECNIERVHMMDDDVPGAAMRHGMPGHAGGGPLAALNLSDEQEDAVFKLHHAQQAKMFANRRAMRKARDEMQALGKAERFDEARARTLADTQGKLMAEGLLQHAQMQSQIRALLTKEQREQFDRLHQAPGKRVEMRQIRMHKEMRGDKR